MASVNKVILIGNLGKDPEVRYMTSGEAVVNFTVATSRQWKDKTSGERHEETEWHRLNAFGRLAEVIGEYLKKGSSAYFEGRIRTRKYEKDGQDRYVTEIIVEQMVMLGSKRDDEGGGERQQPARQSTGSAYADAKSGKTPPPKTGFDDMDSDIPF